VGALDAKRAWTERDMIEDVSAGLGAVKLPVTVVIGDRDHVEHEPALRKTFARFLPQTTFRVLKGVGHLSPLQAPNELADACTASLIEIVASRATAEVTPFTATSVSPLAGEMRSAQTGSVCLSSGAGAVP
jgi:hypothetical protein